MAAGPTQPAAAALCRKRRRVQSTNPPHFIGFPRGIEFGKSLIVSHGDGRGQATDVGRALPSSKSIDNGIWGRYLDHRKGNGVAEALLRTINTPEQ
jgi:hypothetical protein